LQPGEGERLLAACGSLLRAIVEAALETGCRRGELLTLQWWQVRFSPKAELFLPARKTKTKADRTIPISARLRAILDMRRNGPDDKPHPPEAYVFGNEIGEPIASFKRAWECALLKAHGLKPKYVVKIEGEGEKARKIHTAALTPESRTALRRIDLHFHDLRREAGSRWLDAGVPLHRVQKWLGHANIAQTSTYLMADSADDDQAMRRFEEAQARLQRIATDSETGAQTAPPDALRANTNTLNSSEKHHQAHSLLGSGPRGRWFKSTRPDQFLKNPRKSAEFSLAVHSVLMRKSGRENRVLRTSNGGLPRNCSTFPAARCGWFSPALVGAKIGLKPLCSPYADRQHPLAPYNRHSASGRFGAGEISDRDIKRAERLVARNSARLKRMGEVSWHGLTLQPRTVIDTSERGVPL
jgi:hypothetical protein